MAHVMWLHARGCLSTLDNRGGTTSRVATMDQGVDEMTYRLEFVNEGMNHASAEENGLLGIYLISLAILLGGGVYGALLIKLHVEETEVPPS